MELAKNRELTVRTEKWDSVKKMWKGWQMGYPVLLSSKIFEVKHLKVVASYSTSSYKLGISFSLTVQYFTSWVFNLKIIWNTWTWLAGQKERSKTALHWILLINFGCICLHFYWNWCQIDRLIVKHKWEKTKVNLMKTS